MIKKWVTDFFYIAAVGEPPICLSVSIPLAIRNAVASARLEANSSAEKWFAFSEFKSS